MAEGTEDVSVKNVATGGCLFIGIAFVLFALIAPASCHLDDSDEAFLDVQIEAYEAGERSSDDVFAALQRENGKVKPFAILYIADQNEELGDALERHQDQWEEDQEKAEQFDRYIERLQEAQHEADQFCAQLHPRGSSMWRQCSHAKSDEIMGN